MPTHTHARHLRGLLAAALLAAGCGGPPPKPKLAVHPVRGELHVGGKPAGGAVVTFNPPGEPPDGRRPTALVGPDGVFRPNFYAESDGAPEGEYALTVYWPTHLGAPAPDRLKGRYSRPSDPVARVTVKPGENVIEPIRLD